MRNWLVGIAFLSLAMHATPSPASGQACPSPASVLSGVDQREGLIFRTVRYLSDDALEGRQSGTAGERCAGEYIADEFRRLGLRPGGRGGSFFQELSLASVTNPHDTSGVGRNVIGIIPGADPTLATETIVIGAHYDHLGRATTFSLARDSVNSIHNGADDNASGVAALLEAAAVLSSGAPPARTVVFIAFSGEELGLLGSGAFVRDSANRVRNVRAMLNMDMVGRLGAGPMIVYGVGTATEWPELVARTAAATEIRITTQPDGYGASDHTSFYLNDVPVLHFFTNVHGDYHRPTDDWQKIDFPGLRKVAGMVTAIAADLANRRQAITLVKGAGAPNTMGSGGGNGAYLGTVPDFAAVARGVRLSGVTGGSPGALAGLRAGDVLVGFDGKEVADLYAFTDALRARSPGDRVRITVLRNGRELTVEATLGRRAP